ncbi:LuxQ periplasmic sensor domain-containing protein [Vibrio sp. PP-XX7]
MNVRVRPSTIRKKQKIATYFTRAISLVIGILTFGVVFQSYQISSQLITQEVQRTARQTSMLVQEIFDFRLSLLKVHQDSNATNVDLLHAVIQEQIQPIDQYFRMVDQLDPDNTPDIRFISGLNHVLWDDGNAAFFGVEYNELKQLSTRMTVNSTWQLVHLPSMLETIYALARRTPLVSAQTGELIGYFYVLFVLNNNYNLVEHIKNSSHSQNLMLAVGRDVLSTTLDQGEDYTEQDLLLNANLFEKIGLYTVSKTNLLIDNLPTELSIYSVYDNHNVVKLKRNFYYSVLFIVIAMVGLSLILWRWVHKSIWFEIDKLVQFTHNIVDKGAKHTFHGSKIEEFDLFGRALEHTFKRLSEQEKQFENLFNFSTSPTILWGLNGHLIRMNPAAIDVFSQERHIDRWETLEGLLMPEIEKAKQTDIQLDEVITEIDDRMFHWTISPIVHDGRVGSILTQGQDVTTIAEAEKQSHRARDEAERASAARADFLARMSHEVRTPLNGILGVAQLLKDSVSDEKQREHVGVLCLCSEHLLAVLNDILDFSKIEQNKFTISRVRFSLMETIKVIERIYRPLCEEKGVGFCVSMDMEDDIFVLSDQIRL